MVAHDRFDPDAVAHLYHLLKHIGGFVTHRFGILLCGSEQKSLIIGVTDPFGGVEIRIGFFGRDALIGFDDNDLAVRKIGQRRHDLTLVETQSRAAQEAERHIRADGFAQEQQGLFGQMRAEQQIECLDDGCGVRTAACHTGFGRNCLVYMDRNTFAGFIDALKIRFGGFPRRVAVVGRDLRRRAGKLYGVPVGLFHRDGVVNAHRLHNGVNAVVSVFECRGQIEEQIDFCRRLYRNFQALISFIFSILPALTEFFNIFFINSCKRRDFVLPYSGKNLWKSVNNMASYKSIIDMHTHTDNSFDGNHSPVYMCDAACNKGLRAIAFTDHCEVDAYYRDNGERNVRQAFFEIAKARSAFTGKLLVLNGIELGQPAYDIPTAEKIIASQKFDVVIGSVHNLRESQDFYFIEDFSAIDVEARLKEYFSEILTMLEWGNFDILAHLTYPFRYLYAKNNIREDIHRYQDQVDEILKLAAEKDIALEINAAGLRQPINRLSPEAETVARFKELGGRLVSVGSDAHYAQHIGVGIKDAMAAAKDAGFDCVTLFQKRQPMEIPIE